jgi:pyruvate-formate lyase-activating enzyme
MENLTALCVAPFVVQPPGLAVNLDLAASLTTCFGGCCVPCPYQGNWSTSLTEF